MADPNHVVLHKERLVMLLPCKNAQTTIKAALATVMGLSDRHLPYTSLSEIPEGYQVAGVLREPLRRAYSGWAQMYPDWTAERFVAHLCAHADGQLDQHVRSQWCDVSYEGRPRADRWLCVETLEDDWGALCADRGWPVTPLGRLNVGPADKPWWTGAHAEALMERFADDVALYQRVRRVW